MYFKKALIAFCVFSQGLFCVHGVNYPSGGDANGSTLNPKFGLLEDEDLFSDVQTMLDVGCGTGFSLDYFPVADCVGIDPAEKLVEQYEGKQKILVGSAEDLPFNG